MPNGSAKRLGLADRVKRRFDQKRPMEDGSVRERLLESKQSVRIDGHHRTDKVCPWGRDLMSITVRVALAIFAATIPYSAVVGSSAPNQTSQDDQQVQQFLSALKAGKGQEAVHTLLSSSPLWAQRAGASEQMVGQIDAAVKAYGPIVSYEKLSSTNLGTMAIREYYLIQHRDMVTRWEFDLVRTPRGWSVGYFGFTDQPNAWFS